MTIAIIGGGAIGSVVAGFLTRTGVDCLLVARSDQVQAIKDNGLLIKSHDGEERIAVRVADKLDKQYDLVIWTTKSQDLEYAYQDNNEYLEGCKVLMTQNGVQAENLLSTHFEPEDMYSSIVMFGATYIKPGEVIFNFPGDWILGKPFTPKDNFLDELEKILGPAFSVVISQNINGMKWTKLFVNLNNCLPALISQSMQETYADLDFCRISVRLLREAYEVVKAAGVELESLPSFPVDRITGLASMPLEQAAGIINQSLTKLSEEPLYGSILQSIMRGKSSEIDFINGEITHLGRTVQQHAPLNRKVVDLVHQVEQTNNFYSPEEVKKQLSSDES